MFRLLCLPNFAKSLITALALANLAHLRVKILETLTFCDWRRFIVRSDEMLSAFVELERQVLTVTFYLESIHADP
jgi:hypothetical protein